MTEMNLTEAFSALGWDSHWQAEYEKLEEPGDGPARVIASFGKLARVRTREGGEVLAELLLGAERLDGLPTAGDWVICRRNPGDAAVYIRRILPRRTSFTRSAAGAIAYEQPVAANFDHVMIVMSLNDDFNLRRLERYAIAAWNSGAQPHVVLTKADECDDVAGLKAQAEAAVPGMDVLAVSAVTGENMDALKALLGPGRCAVFLGMSGVGKSTLVNTLYGQEVMRVNEIREDDAKGRHTTTHRELVVLPDGSLLIDTPGMRTMGLVSGEADETFTEIRDAAARCRFPDCQHEKEPGCAVRMGIASGEIALKRFEAWKQLQRELRYAQRKDYRMEMDQRRQMELRKRKVSVSDARRGAAERWRGAE